MKKGTIGYITDGIVNPGKFGKHPNSNLRVLWILKEVHAKNQSESWDLREFLGRRSVKEEGLFNYPRAKATYGLVVKVSWGLLNRFIDFKDLPKDFEIASSILDYIAVININKRPGKNRANWKKIRDAFLDLENRRLLLNQIHEINPNIIIGGNTLWYFYNNNVLLDGTDFDGKNWVKFKNGILWIDAYHPNNTIMTHEKYYKEVINQAKKYFQK